MKKNAGVYQKYSIRRLDGKDAPGEKHDNCKLFVLDISHDKYALAALRAYAEACKLDYPALSADLIAILKGQGPAVIPSKEEAFRAAEEA